MFNGFKRGLQLIADFLLFFVRAIEKANAGQVSAAVRVANLWLAEATDLRTNDIKGSIITAMLFGGDPFKGSREALRNLFEEYGDPRGKK